MDDVSNQFVRIDDLRKILNDFLSKVATKDDLQAFATKDDLKNFAREESIEALKNDIDSIKKDLGILAKDIKTIKKDVDNLKSENNKLMIKMRGVSEFQDKLMFQVVTIRHIIEDQLLNIHTFEHFKNDIFTRLDGFGDYEEKNQIEHKTQNYRMKKMGKMLKHEAARNDEQDVKIKNNQERIEQVETKVA